MIGLLFLLLLGLFGVATAKQCRNISVHVEIMTRQGVFNVPEFTSNKDWTTFTQNYTSVTGGTNYTAEVLSGYQNVGGSYKIRATFCTPDHEMGPKPVVQVLSHGIGFDKSYWDIPFKNSRYSYVDVAVDRYGYCTLSFDRLCIGDSSHGDPVNFCQAPAEVAGLYRLNSMLRKGTFPTVNHAFNQPGSIVNVGHSFGAQQSYMLSLMHPEITDAVILTGFSFNGSAMDATVASFNSKIAASNQPMRFGNSRADVVTSAINHATGSPNGFTLTNLYNMLQGFNISKAEFTDMVQSTSMWDLIAGANTLQPPNPQNLPNGYGTWADAASNQYNFFYPTGFDPTMLYYSEATKQPYTIGEILTLGGLPAISPFTGPVQIITGEFDTIYCSGDCKATGMPNVPSIPAAAASLFPSARAFSAYLQPNTGHALNAHFNSSGAYVVIQNFLMSNGIKPS